MSLIYLLFTFLVLFFNFWAVYNIPTVLAGIKCLLNSPRRKCESEASFERELPTISIIVPVKNEEKVVGRLLNALLSLDYPSGKKEIIVVNDVSSDKTADVCRQYSLCHPEIRVFDRLESTTKAAALNFGVQQARGEIIATFDADSIPDSRALLNVIKYFEDPKVAGVQGRVCSVNSEQNMLTKFLSYEGAVQYELYLRGKDALNLFVSLCGTCQFIKRSVLEEVGGWNEDCLSEDTELALRIIEKDYVVKYASEVRTWEESPFTIRGLIRQRVRWYRGNIEMAARFGRLMKRLSFRRFDAEMMLFGTFVMLLCVVNYFMAFWSFSIPPSIAMAVLIQFTSLFTLVTLAVVGIALACLAKPYGLRNVLWLPFIYVYWGLQSFVAMYALLRIIFRRPRTWGKTVRSGLVTTECAKTLLETA